MGERRITRKSKSVPNYPLPFDEITPWQGSLIMLWKNDNVLLTNYNFFRNGIRRGKRKREGGKEWQI